MSIRRRQAPSKPDSIMQRARNPGVPTIAIIPNEATSATTEQNGLTTICPCFAVLTEESVRTAIRYRCIMKTLFPASICCILTAISGNPAIITALQRHIRNPQILMSIPATCASQPFGPANYTLHSRLEKETSLSAHKTATHIPHLITAC